MIAAALPQLSINIEHILLQCSKWDTKRREHLGDMISSMTQEGRQGQDVCTIILGGEYRGIRMPEWLPRRSKGVGDTSERVGCGAYQVAKFFQSISSVRHYSIIRK